MCSVWYWVALGAIGLLWESPWIDINCTDEMAWNTYSVPRYSS